MNKLLSRSLGLRILLLSFGLSLLLALIVIGVMSQLFLSESKQRFWIEKEVTTEAIVQLIDDSLVDRRRALMDLSSMLQDGKKLKPLSEVQRLLDERILLHEFFNGGLLMLDADAVARVDSPQISGRVGTAYDDRAHVQWVTQHLEAYISHPFIGRRLEAPIFVINAPILNQDGVLLGYLVGISLLKDDFMIKDMATRFLKSEQKIYIVDFINEMFVSSNDQRYTFKPFETEGNSPLMQQLNQGVKQGETLGFGGETVLFKAKKMAHIDWYVLTVNRLDKVMAPTYDLLVRSLWLVFSFFLVALPLFYFLMRRQLKPLRRAAKQVEQTLEQSVPVKPLDIEKNDEVGCLLKSFNHLMERQNEVQASLLIARDQASEASKMKSIFLAAMSHDIRTPLNGILGLSEMGIRAKNDPEKMADSLGKIQLSGQSLLTLLNDILDLSKIEAGELRINPDPFYFEDLIKSIQAQFTAIVNKKDLDLLVKLDPNLAAVYRADSHRLGQVLTNLIGNAVKFTEKGFVRLSISHLRQDHQQAWLLFEVQDTGIGMDEQQTMRLFNAFSQGDDTIAQKFGGTGLGLKICQDLVTLMGGTSIEVHSRPEKGSLFSFELPMTLCSPLEIEKAIELVSAKTRYDTSESVGFKLAGKVLVVEDNEINQEIIVELLDHMGLTVYLAENGKQAVDMVSEQGFDLILMDKQMPEMDGYEATRKIREFNQSIPIIALTAAAMSDEREQSKAAGLNDYLTKPIDSQQLAQTLAVWLNQPISSPNVQLAAPKLLEQAPVALIDVTAGLKMLGGKKAFYRSMLQAYHSQLVKDFNLIKQGLQRISEDDNQAWSELARATHSLKGVSANLAAQHMVAVLVVLEDFIAHKQVPSPLFWADWQLSLEQTQQEVDRVVLELEGEQV